MTTEELLIPRYKVIADYPDSSFKIEDILFPFYVEDSTESGRWYVQEDRDYTWINPSLYPAIFKKLEWWEERSLEELPEYVESDNTIYKLYCKNIINGWWRVQPLSNEFGIEFINIKCKDTLPSTKEEYQLQKLNK